MYVWPHASLCGSLQLEGKNWLGGVVELLCMRGVGSLNWVGLYYEVALATQKALIRIRSTSRFTAASGFSNALFVGITWSLFGFVGVSVASLGLQNATREITLQLPNSENQDWRKTHFYSRNRGRLTGDSEHLSLPLFYLLSQLRQFTSQVFSSS